MTRATLGTINPSTTSGAALAALLNNRELAEDTNHAGTGRPTYASAGMLYTESSTTPSHIFLAGAAGDGSQDVDLTSLFADRPGTIRETAEIRLPAGWLWADGSAVVRATYPDLLAAIAPTFTGNVANASTTISTVSEDLRQLGLVGSKIEGTGIQSGTTITAISATTITLSLAANATNTGVTLRAFPQGNGNGSTTFNVPNRKGRVGIGRGDMGGTDVALITVAGAGFDGTKMAAAGGAQTVVLIIANLPVHSHSASSSGFSDTHAGHTHTAGSLATVAAGTHSHTYLKFFNNIFSGAVSSPPSAQQTGSVTFYADTNAPTTTVGNHTHDITGSAALGGAHGHVLTISTSIGNAGSDTAHANVQPSAVSNFVVKT